jgi:acyl carrier protein
VPNTEPVPAAVLSAVRRMVVRESRLSISPQTVALEEPLNGGLLRLTSLGLLGMLIRLEDELGVTLPDDLFAGGGIYTVGDLAHVIAAASEMAKGSSS